MKILIFILSLLVFCFVIFVNWAARTGIVPGMHSDKIVVIDSLPDFVKTEEPIKMMTWNIGFAYGVGSDGSAFVPLGEELMKQRLNDVANEIAKSSPSIVLLQEVDYRSHRSGNIDQLEYLAQKLGFKYYAYSTTWTANYVPYPYWPMTSHFRNISSGGGILSKYPILTNEILIFDKPKENPWWYNLFYLYRYAQIAKIEIDGKQWTLINNHLEAFAKETRQDQAKQIYEYVMQNDSFAKNLMLIGGDFNTTPPNAIKKSEFEGFAQDDYEDDKTYVSIASIPFLREIVSLEEYSDHENKWFTFSSVNPQRRLDYLFVNQQFQVLNRFIPYTTASDHLPVVIELKYSLTEVAKNSH